MKNVNTGNARINIILRRVHVNNSCRGKATIITHSECVSVALVMLHAMYIRRITMTSVACLALPYFPTLPKKREDFRVRGGGVSY